MLNQAAPGYNTSSVNSQNVAPLNTPGAQGIVPQGYNPYKSSYSLPSSYAVPSSFDVPNPYYSQPPQQTSNMVKALRGA